MDTEKIQAALDVFQEPPVYPWKKLMVAICYAKLSRNDSAKEYYSRALDGYQDNPRSRSLWAQYALAMVSVMNQQEGKAKSHVLNLQEKPKYKYHDFIGKSIDAMNERDQAQLNSDLNSALEAHRGMAKFGGLRETPGGYLCLQAMSVTLLALRRGLSIDIQSEYLSMQYLRFLMQHG